MSDLKSVSASVQVPAATPADYVVAVPPSGDILFSDDFETGDLSKIGNGFSWGASNNTSVSQDNPRTGNYSLRFFFNGTGTSWLNSIAEQRFQHGDISEVWISCWIYLPDGSEAYGGSAYDRTTTTESGFTALNHKLNRFWDNDFGYSSNPEKMGTSTWPDNDLAKVSVEYAEEDGGALLTHYNGNIFRSADLGTWVKYIFNAKIESSLGAANGHFKIWRSGVLIDSQTGITNYTTGRNHIFNTGYLFGAANHGFKQDTIIFVDDFTISTTSLL